MNRCLQSASSRLHATGFAFALALGAALISGGASAQAAEPQRIPPISAKAQRGVLRVVAPPDVLMDGQPARLAPGARIRDRNNLMVVSGALLGQELVVRYTRDPLGLVHEVWVLTASEAAVGMPPQPAPTQY